MPTYPPISGAPVALAITPFPTVAPRAADAEAAPAAPDAPTPEAAAPAGLDPLLDAGLAALLVLLLTLVRSSSNGGKTHEPIPALAPAGRCAARRGHDQPAGHAADGAGGRAPPVSRGTRGRAGHGPAPRFAALAAALTAAWPTATVPASPVPQDGRYENPDLGFSFTYPRTWQSAPGSAPSTLLDLTAADHSAVLVVFYNPLPDGSTLEDAATQLPTK